MKNNNDMILTKLKLLIPLLIVLPLSDSIHAQDLLTVKNSINIKANTEIYVKGSVKGAAGGITNNGILSLSGDWTNDVSSSYLGGTGEVMFNSATASQTIGGTSTTSFYDLTIDKSAGDVLLSQDMFVDNILSMANGDLDLQNSTADLGTTGSISSETETTRIKLGDFNTNTGTIQATRTINSVTDFNPGNLGVLITTDSDLGSITVVRGHQVQQGSGSFTGNNSVARYYEIPGIGQLDANISAEMHYWDAELNGHTEANLKMYQWVEEGSSSVWWTPLDGSVHVTSQLVSPTTTPYNSNINQSINFTELFTLGSTDAPLPVEWLSFMADWKDETCNSVKLEWETASEVNSDYYEIQRSTDVETWENIKTTDAAGFSNQNIEYTDYDESPPREDDIIYYRLKQVDNDGSFEYSDVEAVTARDNPIEIISVFPNPADDEITIEIESVIDTRVYIYVWDKSGKTVIMRQAEIVTGKNDFKINISHLASSIYTVQVITENGNHKTEKQFVK